MSNADKIIDLINSAQTPTGNKVVDYLILKHQEVMITNSKTMAHTILTDLNKIDGIEIDSAKKAASYMIEWLKDQLDFTDGRHDLLNRILLEINQTDEN